MSLALLNLKLSAKTCWWPRWPQKTLAGALGQHLTLGHHEWPKSTWFWKNYTLLMRWEGFQYFPHWLIWRGTLTWPQVIDISKIRDMKIVGTSGLIKFWKLEKILLRTVAVARVYTFLEVRSRDSTWWPDLMWPQHKNFTTDVKLINEKLCQVWLRCSLSFSSYPRKTTGGPIWPPPGRRLIYLFEGAWAPPLFTWAPPMKAMKLVKTEEKFISTFTLMVS